MSWETMVQTIMGRVKTEVEDGLGTTLAYDNAYFDPPDDSIWARVAVLFSETTQETVGTSQHRYRNPGRLVFSVFAPIHRGEGEALALCDSIAAKFRSVTVSGVVFRTPSVERLGTDSGRGNEKAPTWQINVSIPFYYDVDH